MPNTKSAIRRTKRTRRQTLVNRIRKSKYKIAIKKMNDYIIAGKTKEAKEFLPKWPTIPVSVICIKTRLILLRITGNAKSITSLNREKSGLRINPLIL